LGIFLTNKNVYSQDSFNLKDGNGLHQGIWKTKSYNNRVVIENYLNDTLNDCYELFENKILKQKGFYVKGLKDSIWFDYYDFGGLESISQFKNGKRNGIFLEFYKSGKIKKECNYVDDRQMNLSIYYNENGSINRTIDTLGYYRRYHENGRLEMYGAESKEVGFFMPVLKLNEKGDTIFPRKIPQKLFTKINKIDTIFGIINKSSLKVELLFNQYDSKQRNNIDYVNFGLDLFDGPKAFLKDSTLNFLFSGTQILVAISPNQIEFIHNNRQSLGKSIKTITYKAYKWWLEEGTVSKLKTKKNNLVKEHLKNSCAVIHSNNEGCDDSGRNPVDFYPKKGKISFTDIDNLLIAECDLDKDGYNEVYLMSFISCECSLRIYKISK